MLLEHQGFAFWAQGQASDDYRCSCRDYEAEGHDLHTLLFQYLDEMLFVFATEMFVPCKVGVTLIDRSSWKIKATGYVYPDSCHASLLSQSEIKL